MSWCDPDDLKEAGHPGLVILRQEASRNRTSIGSGSHSSVSVISVPSSVPSSSFASSNGLDLSLSSSGGGIDDRASSEEESGGTDTDAVDTSPSGGTDTDAVESEGSSPSSDASSKSERKKVIRSCLFYDPADDSSAMSEESEEDDAGSVNSGVSNSGTASIGTSGSGTSNSFISDDNHPMARFHDDISYHLSDDSISDNSSHQFLRRSLRIEAQPFYVDYQDMSFSWSDEEYSIRTDSSASFDDSSDSDSSTEVAPAVSMGGTQQRITDYFHYTRVTI